MTEAERTRVVETTDQSAQVADILLGLGAISLSPDRPFVYSSGMVSPVYCDSRLLISYPSERRFITRCFCGRIVRVVGEKSLDVVAATAMSGIPFGAWIAEQLDKPMVFVRSEEKSHGKMQKLEGVIRAGQNAVVIEDSITTARSAISTAEAVRSKGAMAEHCFAVYTYNLAEASHRLRSGGLTLHPLCTFDILIQRALDQGRTTLREYELLLRWRDSQNASYALPETSR